LLSQLTQARVKISDRVSLGANPGVEVRSQLFEAGDSRMRWLAVAPQSQIISRNVACRADG